MNLNKGVKWSNSKRRLILAKKLKIESKIVRKNSMAVLREFEDIDYLTK